MRVFKSQAIANTPGPGSFFFSRPTKGESFRDLALVIGTPEKPLSGVHWFVAPTASSGLTVVFLVRLLD